MAKRVVTQAELNKKACELLELARKTGVEQNYFFLSTFDRYQTQLDILADLKKVIKDANVIVSKSVGKKENLDVHPAIKEFNKTATAANQTAQTLLKIISSFTEASLVDSIEDEGEDDL